MNCVLFMSIESQQQQTNAAESTLIFFSFFFCPSFLNEFNARITYFIFLQKKGLYQLQIRRQFFLFQRY
jgi:hypothetical protein